MNPAVELNAIQADMHRLIVGYVPNVVNTHERLVVEANVRAWARRLRVVEMQLREDLMT